MQTREQSRKGHDPNQSDRGRPPYARVKIEADTVDLIEEIIDCLVDNFPSRCIASRVLKSSRRGFHAFVNVLRGGEK